MIHEILCGVLLWTVFCRAVRTNGRVRTDVRGAFVLLGSAASLAMAAPLAWAWKPDAISLMLLAAFCAVQISTSRHWNRAVPDCLYKPGCEPRGRRREDR